MAWSSEPLEIRQAEKKTEIGGEMGESDKPVGDSAISDGSTAKNPNPKFAPLNEL